ncbi:491_t:CDS:2, partial [Racocetra fulgida]
HFVRACNLLVSRIINENELKEAYERLKDMACIIESTYGPEFITSNIHLALHISDCCQDYGSLALTSTMDNEELKYFLSLRYQTSVALKIYDTEPIPGHMLFPSYIGVIISLELKNLCMNGMKYYTE